MIDKEIFVKSAFAFGSLALLSYGLDYIGARATIAMIKIKAKAGANDIANARRSAN